MIENDIKNEVCNMARNLGACRLIDGIRDLEELSKYIFAPQGLEFCTIHQFPALDILQQHKDIIEKYGYFVDCGFISRSNDNNIVLAGDTTGELSFDDPTSLHKVILMHGAKATINASNYVVIKIYQIGECNFEVNKDQTSIIL
ncbi:MAG: hypothetical protein J6U85_03755 [Bacteroidales bacterium]|nr:hypothetical protein [Bacteroidales bacterium]